MKKSTKSKTRQSKIDLLNQISAGKKTIKEALNEMSKPLDLKNCEVFLLTDGEPDPPEVLEADRKGELISFH